MLVTTNSTPIRLWNKSALIQEGFLNQYPLARVESNEELISLWLQGKPAETIRAYRKDIDYFLAFIENKPLPRVTFNDFAAYRKALEEHVASKNGADSTVARRLLGVRSLFRFAHEDVRVLRENVTKPIKPPKPKDTRAERILTEGQVLNMIGQEPDPRNKLLLRFLYETGCRISELTILKWRDLVELENGTAQVTFFGKGNKTRHVLLTPSTWEELQIALTSSTPDAPVFISQWRRPLSETRIREIVRAAAERVGINLKVSPHWLRHCHATHALHRQAPLVLVQETLGHASVATTSRYLHSRPINSSSL